MLALAATAALRAQTADLVTHNGFEACWSQALTQAQFLDAMQSSLDGTSTCIAPISATQNGTTVDACDTAACPGGQTGCIVTVHAGAFSGDFGSGLFSATGSADDIVVPVTTSGAIASSCTITIANIALSVAPDYTLIADGNNGDYTAALVQAPLSLDSYDLQGSGDVACVLAAEAYQSDLVGVAESEGTALAEARLRATTLNASICPLTP